MAAVHDDVQIAISDPQAHSLFFYPSTSFSSKVLKDTSKGGFVLGSLNRKRGTFTFFNGDGEKLYSYWFQSRKGYQINK